MDWAYTISGLVVGFVVGLTGVGGGSLMTPLLILLFGVNPAVAVGTDLLYASVTKAGGAWVHARRGHVDWQTVRRLATGSVPGALLTVLALRAISPDSEAFSQVITTTLGVALLLSAVALLLRGRLQDVAQVYGEQLTAWKRRWIVPATVGTGVALGVLVTVSSVGAGALGGAALLFLFPWAPVSRIVGTDIAHAVPLTLVAGLGHLHLGTVDLGLLGGLLLGSLPGIWLGSHASARVPEGVLRPLLATMLALIGIRFVL